MANKQYYFLREEINQNPITFLLIGIVGLFYLAIHVMDKAESEYRLFLDQLSIAIDGSVQGIVALLFYLIFGIAPIFCAVITLTLPVFLLVNYLRKYP